MSPDEEKALRDARPSWSTDGHGIQGNHPMPRGIQQAVNPGGRFALKIEESSTTPFPQSTAESTENTTQGGEAATNEYSFQLEVDSIDQDAGTVDIHVGYGEINDTAPDGMTGDDDYIVTISADGTEVYAVITYDLDTLEITSRSLNWGPSVPDSVEGTVYVALGFVDISYDLVSGKIKEVNPHNRHCGDINLALVYAALNGASALYPLAQLSNPFQITLA